MSEYLFLGRLKDQSDRDCCLYIENKNPRWECDHYFGKIILHGSCFWHSDFPDYDEISGTLTPVMLYRKDISIMRSLARTC